MCPVELYFEKDVDNPSVLNVLQYFQEFYVMHMNSRLAILNATSSIISENHQPIPALPSSLSR